MPGGCMTADNQKAGVLIAGAFAPELDLIPRDLPRLHVFEAGIGSLPAALRLERSLAELPPISEVVFLGSAGVYETSASHGPGRFGRSTVFTKYDATVLEGRGRVVGPLAEALCTEKGPVAAAIEAAAGFRSGVCNSTDSVTLFQPKLVGGLAARPDFENLEAYGLAAVCLHHGLRFAAFFALTNAVSEDGSSQWREHHVSMGKTLQEIALKTLKNREP